MRASPCASGNCVSPTVPERKRSSRLRPIGLVGTMNDLSNKSGSRQFIATSHNYSSEKYTFLTWPIPSRQDFVDTVDAGASVGELTADDLRLIDQMSRLAGSGAVDRIRLAGSPSVQDRFDAHTKMLDLHAKRAYGRSI